MYVNQEKQIYLGAFIEVEEKYVTYYDETLCRESSYRFDYTDKGKYNNTVLMQYFKNNNYAILSKTDVGNLTVPRHTTFVDLENVNKEKIINDFKIANKELINYLIENKIFMDLKYGLFVYYR